MGFHDRLIVLFETTRSVRRNPNCRSWSSGSDSTASSSSLPALLSSSESTCDSFFLGIVDGNDVDDDVPDFRVTTVLVELDAPFESLGFLPGFDFVDVGFDFVTLDADLGPSAFFPGLLPEALCFLGLA